MSRRQRNAGNVYAAGSLSRDGASRDPEISWERAAWLLILGWSLCSAAIVSLLPGLFGLG
jgi:hypothetical protein